MVEIASDWMLEIEARELCERLDGDDALLMDDLLLIDCREEDEITTVRLTGAVWLPMSAMTERASEIHRDVDIVVYCADGGRSLRCATWLRQQGFRARYLVGGLLEYCCERFGLRRAD